MPEARIFRSGFSGASLPAATEWTVDHVGDATSILVPFAGSGRDIAAMAGEGRTIWSFDTQFYSRAIVEGIFAAKKPESNVDKIRYTKGWMFEHRMKNMDERSAGFIDWVGKNGTMYDKAAMASAIVRSTLMGRMNQWYANVEKLYSRFMKNLESNAEWCNLPGKFVHVEGSFYDRLETTGIGGTPAGFDLIQVDPPKVVVGSDIYSAYYNDMNRALGGHTDLPKWNWRDVMPRFRQLMDVPTDRVLFFYVSGVRPDWTEVERMLKTYGTVEDEAHFTHQGRTDYAIDLRRKSE